MKNIKKISYLLFVFVAMFMIMSPVFADMEACNTIGGSSIDIDSKIADSVHIIVLILQIAVPVLLVIFGSIDFVKAVTSGKEDEIKKGQQTFIKRLIAAAFVFFVIAIVKLIVSFASGDESPNILNCVDCFLSGSSTTKCKTKYKIVKPTNTTEKASTTNTTNSKQNNG